MNSADDLLGDLSSRFNLGQLLSKSGGAADTLRRSANGRGVSSLGNEGGILFLPNGSVAVAGRRIETAAGAKRLVVFYEDGYKDEDPAGSSGSVHTGS